MDGLGVIFATVFSVLYPLIIWLLIKKVRFEREPYRYLLAAFILGAAVFYLAYLRKLYVLFFSGLALYSVDLVATGFIEEAAKLLILVIPFIRRRMDERNGAFYGLVVGLGFGGGEAILLLASAAASYSSNQLGLLLDLTALNSLAMQPLTQMQSLLVGIFVLPQLISETNALLSLIFGFNLLGISPIAIYERIFTILFHASTATLIGYGLVRGKTLKYYMAAVALHIFLDFFAILYLLGFTELIVTETIITAISLPLFVYVLYKKVLTVNAS
ncbi:MAG: YhfC family glutamic-type intramembrane protease [Candidatus Freyarchaeum deiterrae]